MDVVPNPDNVIPDDELLSPIVPSILFLYIFSTVISSINKSYCLLPPINKLYLLSSKSVNIQPIRVHIVLEIPDISISFSYLTLVPSNNFIAILFCFNISGSTGPSLTSF